MKTLVIHPFDPSTNFLKGIYEHLADKTVITGGIRKLDLQKHILCHDRVIMCGHGSPSGLFSVGEFPDSYPYVIDDSIVSHLRYKTNIFIWCNADQFVKRNGIQGLCSGMFISEVDEALWYGFEYRNNLENLITESNHRFSSIIGKYINEPMDILYKNLMSQYGYLGNTNAIVEFNCQRIYLNLPTYENCNTRL